MIECDICGSECDGEKCDGEKGYIASDNLVVDIRAEGEYGLLTADYLCESCYGIASKCFISLEKRRKPYKKYRY